MRKNLIDLYEENRPWEKFEKFVENEKCTIKILNVNPNSKTSLQMHKKRMSYGRFWMVLHKLIWRRLPMHIRVI